MVARFTLLDPIGQAYSQPVELTSPNFEDGQPIPLAFAFCAPDGDGGAMFSSNRNPGLEWHDAPSAARSFAIVCVDPDAPSVGDDVNRTDREVPSDLERADFYHWAVVDIPTGRTMIEAGDFSEGVTPRGKPDELGPYGTRQGLNDYTGWFAGDDDMEGEYFGYDGPCPPWNDSIPHRYRFTVYALDVEQCPVVDPFTGADVLAAVESHVLAQASLTGTYALNPRLLA